MDHKTAAIPTKEFSHVTYGDGVTGIVIALLKSGVLIGTGNSCQGSSAIGAQIHHGLEYSFDSQTQRDCSLARVFCTVLFPSMTVLKNRNFFVVNADTEASNPGSAQKLEDSATQLNARNKQLFETLESEYKPLAPTQQAEARQLITDLSRSLCLESGDVAKRLPNDAPSIQLECTKPTILAFETSQKAVNANMFLTLARKFLETQTKTKVYPNTTVTHIKNPQPGVVRIKTSNPNLPEFTATHVDLANGTTYPSSTITHYRAMAYWERRPTTSASTIFIVSGPDGAMKEFCGLNPHGNTSIEKLYLPNTQGCQLSSTPPYHPSLTPAVHIALDEATRQAHFAATIASAHTNFQNSEDAQPLAFLTFPLAQHIQSPDTPISERPYHPPTPYSPETTDITCNASEKFSYAVLNVLPQDQVHQWRQADTDFSGILKALLDLKRRLQPFTEFCHLQMLGENQGALRTLCLKSGQAVQLPADASWNYQFDPTQKGKQFYLLGHFVDRLQRNNFSEEKPITELQKFKVGLFEINQVDGKAVLTPAGAIHSRITYTPEQGYTLSTTTPAPTSTTSWGEFCEFNTPTQWILESPRPLSEVIETLKQSGGPLPIAVSITGTNPIQNTRGQIFIPFQNIQAAPEASDTPTPETLSQGVALKRAKFVFELPETSIQTFSIAGFFNPPELLQAASTGAWTKLGGHFHGHFTLKPDIETLTGEIIIPEPASARKHTLTLNTPAVVTHILDDVVLPAGTVVEWM